MGFDFQHMIELGPDIIKAFGQTMYMIGISLTVAIIIGLPLGIVLFITDRGVFLENRYVKSTLGFVSNMVRSILVGISSSEIISLL